MSKFTKKTIFVCSSIIDNILISEEIVSASVKEAEDIFTSKYNMKPKVIFGPYNKKRIDAVEVTKVLKFSNQTKKAIYKSWFVTAFLLVEPENQAYLVFGKQIDDKIVQTPKGTVTVPISELRFI